MAQFLADTLAGAGGRHDGGQIVGHARKAFVPVAETLREYGIFGQAGNGVARLVAIKQPKCQLGGQRVILLFRGQGASWVIGSHSPSVAAGCAAANCAMY